MQSISQKKCEGQPFEEMSNEPLLYTYIHKTISSLTPKRAKSECKKIDFPYQMSYQFYSQTLNHSNISERLPGWLLSRLDVYMELEGLTCLAGQNDL